MVSIAFILLCVFLIIGLPISFSCGLSAVLGIIIGGKGVIPGAVVAQQMTGDLNTFTLLAIPLFMLAGNIMYKADISSRLLNFVKAMLAGVRGGMGMACIGANAIFAGITGSGFAAITSIGQMSIQGFEKEGYEKGFYSALIAGGGALGPVIPPSGAMIVYGVLTGMSVGRLFVGGIGPGIAIALGMCLYCYFYAKKRNIDYGGKFNPKEAVKAFCDAFFALMMPVIMIGGVISGIFTATEAGVVASLYGIICGMFIYRTMKFKDLIDACVTTATTCGMVLMILITTGIFGFMFARSGTAKLVTNWLAAIPGMDDALILYTVMMIFFFIVGIPLEVMPVLRVIMPLIYPTVLASGIDPLVFGMSAVIMSVIGSLSPPIGNFIFMSMKVCDCTYTAIERPMWMITFIYVFVVLFSGYIFPQLITFIPDLTIPI